MADIDLTPTEEMAANAKRGLELRRKHGRGGTAVGVARARDISNRKTLSPETVRRMHAFFSRHEKNKAGGEDDAGYIAWMLWSGDAGQGWAKRKVEQMDKSENQRSETYKAIAERLGSAATNARPGAKAKMGRMLHLHEVDELEEFLDAYGVKDYDIIESIGQVKVPKSQVGKALDAIASLNREIRKEGIGGSVAVDVVPFSRPGAKAEMALDMSVLSGAKSLEVFIKDLMGAINVGNAREAIAVCEDISKKANDVKQRIRDTSKFSRPGAKDTNAVREGSKISAEDEACLKVMSAADEKVSDKIRTLIAEGKPQKQAVAIALDLKRRGEL